jgi:hypothetical protein
MFKLALSLFIVAASSPALAAEAQNKSFVPRLISAIDDYMGAYQVCLVRAISTYPVERETPEQIASASISACQKSDAAVRKTTQRVHGFPSVSNFMAGISERIFAFSVRLAKARIASRQEPKRY